MFEGMTKNSLFSCLMAVLMSYCAQFWCSKAIYMFERYDQKLVVVFCFMPLFMSYCHSIGVPGKFICLRVMFEISSFCVLWTFSGVIPHSLGVIGRFTTTIIPDTFKLPFS